MVEALLVGGKEQVCEPTSPRLQLASAACHVGTKTPPLPSFTMPISHGACAIRKLGLTVGVEEGVLNLGGNEMMRRFSLMPREKKLSLMTDEGRGWPEKEKKVSREGCEDYDSP